MNSLNLIKIARELLYIHEEFPNHLNDFYNHKINNFKMETFTQIWGNTSGGFEGIGGSAMTEQRTYVFIPIVENEPCQVYFGGRYAYSVPITDLFIKDVREHKVAGIHSREKYLVKGN